MSIIEDIESSKIKIKDLEDIDLSVYTGEEKTQLINICEEKTAFWDTNQMALKISINAVYGSLSNIYFVLFNRDVAASITGNGRIYIRGLGYFINNKFNKMFNNSDNYWIYSDTDSVVGSSKIETKLFGKTTIEKYFKEAPGDIEKRGENNLIKHLDFSEFDLGDDEAHSLDKNGKVNLNNVKYVMAHKVKKRMFKITVNGKSVEVTEDHSIIVKRNGEYKDIKPKDLKKGDILTSLY